MNFYLRSDEITGLSSPITVWQDEPRSYYCKIPSFTIAVVSYSSKIPRYGSISVGFVIDNSIALFCFSNFMKVKNSLPLSWIIVLHVTTGVGCPREDSSLLTFLDPHGDIPQRPGPFTTSPIWIFNSGFSPSISIVSRDLDLHNRTVTTLRKCVASYLYCTSRSPLDGLIALRLRNNGIDRHILECRDAVQ